MTIYYMNADGGDNGNDGSSGSPWLTPTYAIAQLSAGDELVAQDSTAHYAWLTSALTIADGCTIRGESTDGSGAIFDGAGGTTYPLRTTTANGYTIENVTFTALKNSDDKGCFSLYSTTVASAVTFTNCVFDACQVWTGGGGYGGMWANRQGGLGSYTITGCLIKNCYSPSGANGTYASFRDGAVEFNFYNNTIYSVATGTGFVFGFFLYLNTTMSGNIKNNIFYNGTGSSVSLCNWTPTAYTANCAYTSFTDIPSGTGNITSDPLFVDAPGGNFELQGSSPCIGTGVII